MIPISFHMLQRCQPLLQDAVSQPPRSSSLAAGAAPRLGRLHVVIIPSAPAEALLCLGELRQERWPRLIKMHPLRGGAAWPRGGSGGGALLPPASDPSSRTRGIAAGSRHAELPRGRASEAQRARLVRSQMAAALISPAAHEPRGGGGRDFSSFSFENPGRTPRTAAATRLARRPGAGARCQPGLGPGSSPAAAPGGGRSTHFTADDPNASACPEILTLEIAAARFLGANGSRASGTDARALQRCVNAAAGFLQGARNARMRRGEGSTGRGTAQPRFCR